MTTVLSDEDGNAMKLKEKLLNGSNPKEESRSFLNFSQENLNISQTDLEEGFNKQRFRPNRYMVLSTSALLIALLCFALETWKLRCSLVNAREIEELKRDVKSLNHRFLQQDLLDELKTFEEQLYAGESTDEEDPGELDIENAEYDSNYDDEDSSSSHDYSGDYRTLSIVSKNSDPSKSSTSTITKTSTQTPATLTDSEATSTADPVSDKALVEILAALKKVEAKRGEDFERNVRKNHRNIEDERLAKDIEDERLVKDINEQIDEISKQKPRLIGEVTDMQNLDPIKRKRSIRDENQSRSHNVTTSSRAPRQRNQTRKVTRHRFHNHVEAGRITGNDRAPLPASMSALSSDRHPPKKFYSHTHPDTSHAFPSNRYDDDLTSEIARSGQQAVAENERRDHDLASMTMETSGVSRELRRVVTRRHLRAPRQVCAVHYGADSILFSEGDEHTGNGRARHGNGVFKAWRPDDWVVDLGMDRYFTLARNGKLTVHESGLYLVYAQIHYLDEHDENGFHLLVNDRPVLQCTIFSPGVGHKSRSCFSAQVIILQAGDVLLLKDIGVDRYTLFQHDKSFFGLAKLGESRQQRHPTVQPPQ